MEPVAPPSVEMASDIIPANPYIILSVHQDCLSGEAHCLLQGHGTLKPTVKLTQLPFRSCSRIICCFLGFKAVSCMCT